MVEMVVATMLTGALFRAGFDCRRKPCADQAQNYSEGKGFYDELFHCAIFNTKSYFSTIDLFSLNVKL
jgi:hypothetical protein